MNQEIQSNSWKNPTIVITNTRADMIYKAMEEMDSLETFPSIHQVHTLDFSIESILRGRP